MRALLVAALLIFLAGCEQPLSTAPHIIAFHAEWCGPCQRDMPQLRSIEAQGYAVTHIDADARPDLINSYGVRSLPTYIVYRGDGQPILRTTEIERVLPSLR